MSGGITTRTHVCILLFVLMCIISMLLVSAHKGSDAINNDLDNDDDDPLWMDEFEDEPVTAAKRSADKPSSNNGAKDTIDDDDDDDEPEEEYVVPPVDPKRSSERPPKVAKVTLTMDKQSYWAEVVAICFIVVYIINFFVGKSTNDRIAQKWFESFKGLFDNQFAAIGAYEGADIASSGGILKESQSCFKFYASGRRHCSGLLATIELRKRQDLFSLVLALVDLSTIRDTVTIEIPMNDEDMEPFVFAIVRRRLEKKMRKTFKDIENYTGTTKSARVPSSFCILTDCAELEREFLDDRVARTLEQFDDLLISIHFTDQNTSGGIGQQALSPSASLAPLPFVGDNNNATKKLLRFKFALPKSPIANMEQLRTLTEMAVHFIDRVASKQLSAQARQRAIDNRKQVAEKAFRATHQQRQEAALKRKEDMKRRDESVADDRSSKKRQPKVKVIR